MVMVRALYILILVCLSCNLYASEYIQSVVVECDGKSDCVDIISGFKELEGQSRSKKELYKYFDFELKNPIYKSFNFSLKNGILNIETSLREKVSNISIVGADEVLRRRVFEDFPIKEGDFFNKKLVEDALAKIEQLYFTQGDENLSLTTVETEEGISLNVSLSNIGINKVGEVEVTGVNRLFEEKVRSMFEGFSNKTWDKTIFKRHIEELEIYLDSLGYWNSIVKTKVLKEAKVRAQVNVRLGKRYAFNFHGVTYFEHYKLTSELKKIVKNRRGSLNSDSIIHILSKLYKDRGVFYSSVKVRKVKGKDENSPYEFFFIDVKEGTKVRLEEVIFSGNREISTKKIEDVYNSNASTLLSRGYLDIKALDSVKNKLKEYYISNGYIFSSIEDPIIVFSESGKSAFVTFKVTESNKYTINKINISGVTDKKMVTEIKRILYNKEGKNFDVIKVDQDLKTALEYVKEKGYFFNSYLEKNPKKIVNVSSASKSVDLNLKFKTGKKTYLGNLIVTGNLLTKDIVVKREVKVARGELITPQKMNSFVNRLRSLGLFTRVNITPFIGNKKGENAVYLNFIVKVKEKNFGRGEVAPGFRTDLGYKISGTVSYNNISGLNRSVIAKAQANRRTSYSYLDERRQSEQRDPLEGILQLQYVEPYLFGKEIEMKISTKAQRKRYSGFDADILSLSPIFTKEFNKYFTSSLKYEIDYIKQYDATLEEDKDSFKIGAITPSATFDFRDNPAAPTKGAWFNLSWEFANPYFGAQSDDDLTINYNRAVSRNYFYIPIGKIVLATSMTFGVEKNFAKDLLTDENGDAVLDSDGEQKTKGFIPSLKVFRLSGRDILRGFSDDESNVLIDGTEISDIIVRDMAYLVNFKIEPRYYLSDNSVIALFFDAGRVFNKSVRFFDLKTSAGVSFKVLTPVGSLDFDYGVKLKRDRFDSGGRETFGRFHVSIGQF